jgi:predicted DNA-binding protein (MmcQ/YjbR family)
MLKTQVKEKKIIKAINVKCDDETIKKLQENADLYAGGNLSEWLRYTGLNYVPKSSELSNPPKKTKKK